MAEVLVQAKKFRVRVFYWRGTLQLSGVATTYAGAMRIAARNRNAFGPTFFEVDTGEQLYDDGCGLRYESGRPGRRGYVL